MSTRQDFVTKISSYVAGSDLPLGKSDKETAIALAVDYHSTITPRVITTDVTGAATFFYKCSTYLTSWIEDFSIVKSVEYPVDDTDEEPHILQEEEIILDYKKNNESYLRFLDDSPTVSETFRVTYTTKHTVDDTTSTISTIDENALAVLASSFFCNMLAGFYAQQGNSIIGADSVNNNPLMNGYIKMAETYFNNYHTLKKIKPDQSLPASINFDWDAEASWQEDKLTHKARYR